MLIGRIAWDESGKNWTPWMTFENITKFQRWCRDMRRALGKPGQAGRIRSEYLYADVVWTADALLAEAQEGRF